MWHKHGYVCLYCPFKPDLTISTDIERNPGPDTNQPGFVGNIQRQTILKSSKETSSRSTTDVPYANEVIGQRLIYTRSELLRLRSSMPNGWPVTLKSSFHLFGSLFYQPRKYRRSRAGKRIKDKRKALIKNIQTLVTHQRASSVENQRCRIPSNLITVELVNNISTSTCKPSLPSILITNVRSLMPKVDELDVIAQANAVDIVTVTETWLTNEIPDEAPSISNYNFFRKDRHNLMKSCGGGVGIYIHNSHPAKRLYDFECHDIESLWVSIRPNRLPRHTPIVLCAVVYHPPSSNAQENELLLDHLQSNIDQFLIKHPDSLVIITGDFNPSGTNLKVSKLTGKLGLSQIIKVKTRDSGVLDLCLVNKPKLFQKPRQLPKIGSSDHYAIIIDPVVNVRRKLTIHQPNYQQEMKESNIRDFGQWITVKNWNDVLELEDCEEKYTVFMTTLSNAIKTFFPSKRCKTSSKDKPWVTLKLKILVSRRQSAFCKYGKSSCEYGQLRNMVQREIERCKSVYYRNRINSFKDNNVAKWWKETKRLGGTSNNNEWFHQLLCDEIPTVSQLTEHVNDFFINLTSEFQPLNDITNNCIDVPNEFLITEGECYRDLKSVKCSKSPGPDFVPNRILKEFALELAPIVTNIYNTSMLQGVIPLPLKRSIVSPIPKCTPPKTIEDDLRPISLTTQISKIMEGFTLKPLLRQITSKLDPFQFATKGRSTTQALVYILHNILEAMDKGNCSVRAFFADFSKGFDLVDHNVLCAELVALDIHPAIVRWIRSFLTKRSQCVRINNTVSDYKVLNGGIPQGTKLGPILFAILVNSLVDDWNFRVKYVDDLSTIEIIPRCSPSVMPYIINDIHHFASMRGMRLNPKKCKEIFINSLQYRLPTQSLFIGDYIVESVESFKLLGVYLSYDLTWNTHCDYIIKKALKRLYIIRQLRKAGYNKEELVTLYCCLVRPILEYAVPVWAALPSYLCENIESIQRRAMRIIFPGIPSYSSSLESANLNSLRDRRSEICEKFIDRNKTSGPLKHLLISNSFRIDHGYNLRSGTTNECLISQPRTLRLSNFVTYKYR